MVIRKLKLDVETWHTWDIFMNDKKLTVINDGSTIIDHVSKDAFDVARPMLGISTGSTGTGATITLRNLTPSPGLK